MFALIRKRRASKLNRPLVKPEMTPIDWLLEGLALLGLMFLAGYVIYQFPGLPDIIPSHFNGAGQPDDYSQKSSILALPAIGTFLYFMLTLIALIPHQFNYTITITPANALKQYTIAIRLVRYLKAAIIWLFFYISFATVRVVAKEDSGLGLWFLPITLGGIFIPIIIYVIMASRHR